MPNKIIRKFFVRFVSFTSLFLLGILSFNLFHIQEKLEMWRAVNVFHSGQVNNNKIVIDNLLADNFTETGVNIAVSTPEKIYKSNLVDYDYSQVSIKIEADYPLLLNMFSNNYESLSFVRTLTVLHDDFSSSSFKCYVTYTFEKRADGLKISKAERKLKL